MAPQIPIVPASSDKYVNLGEKFEKSFAWTNDPKDMDIATYFSDEPSIGGSYNIKGLKPVIKDKFSEEYLLTDAEGKYYRWNAEFPGLTKLDQTKVRADTPLSVAMQMMVGIPDDCWLPQFRNQQRAPAAG